MLGSCDVVHVEVLDGQRGLEALVKLGAALFRHHRQQVRVRAQGDGLVGGLDDRAGLAATAERVRMLAEDSWIQKGETQVRVTVSVGATMVLPTESADDLVDRAGGLMYTSKRGGRNRLTTDTGVLISGADRPILGTAIPWETASS